MIIADARAFVNTFFYFFSKKFFEFLFIIHCIIIHFGTLPVRANVLQIDDKIVAELLQRKTRRVGQERRAENSPYKIHL